MEKLCDSRSLVNVLQEQPHKQIPLVTYLIHLPAGCIDHDSTGFRVGDKLFDTVEMVERDDDDIFWSWAHYQLVLEPHGHQVKQL